MTDVLNEDHGRKIVARKSFSNEAVWLPMLGVYHLNAGQPLIRGLTFTECVIEGPALVGIIDGVSFEGCNMGVATDPASLFYKAQGSVLVGTVAFADTKFIRCRFVQVAFTGHAESLDQMAADLISARAEVTGNPG
ncbi:hypothetical protein ACETK8_03320 [Brevundimonas staleyi]|uniref:PilZ domain-containing protein n=1 Tax=Brevundimonas staleyi TaxID=74326 RepID=A0ABW0FTG2_9CAUL